MGPHPCVELSMLLRMEGVEESNDVAVLFPAGFSDSARLDQLICFGTRGLRSYHIERIVPELATIFNEKLVWRVVCIFPVGSVCMCTW